MDPVSRPARDRSPTIRDVARRAGVGVGTVSRVLNQSPLVSVDRRDRVQQAIEELGYRRSTRARNLSLGRSQAVGVVAPFFTTPSVVERLRGVVEALTGRGYDLLLFDVETITQRADAFRHFARRDRLDGLLVLSLPILEDEMIALRAEELPLVLVDARRPGLAQVVVDDVHGGDLATEHLLERGHREIAFLGDLPSPLGFTASEDRCRGYRQALRRAGIEPERALEWRAPHGREHARQLAEGMLARRRRPTAVFAASDVQAVGVLEAAETCGLRVPEDLAVMGFDDIEIAAVAGLSTVRQPLRESGRIGASILLAEIDGVERRSEELPPLVVVERRTS
jgi:DNA-binding LacI/PurR family transcriptional regulator